MRAKRYTKRTGARKRYTARGTEALRVRYGADSLAFKRALARGSD